MHYFFFFAADAFGVLALFGLPPFTSMKSTDSAGLDLVADDGVDAGEITDKGYINQRVAQDHRAGDVAALFTPEPGPGVVKLA